MESLLAPALVTALTTLLLSVAAMNVGRMRGRHRVLPPATTGHPEFERAYRVQMNTLENAVAFLPVLWLCALFTSPFWAGVGGACWLAGRVGYAIGYSIAPRYRVPGFLLSQLTLALVTLGALAGIAARLL